MKLTWKSKHSNMRVLIPPDGDHPNIRYVNFDRGIAYTDANDWAITRALSRTSGVELYGPPEVIPGIMRRAQNPGILEALDAMTYSEKPFMPTYGWTGMFHTPDERSYMEKMLDPEYLKDVLGVNPDQILKKEDSMLSEKVETFTDVANDLQKIETEFKALPVYKGPAKKGENVFHCDTCMVTGPAELTFSDKFYTRLYNEGRFAKIPYEGKTIRVKCKTCGASKTFRISK